MFIKKIIFSIFVAIYSCSTLTLFVDTNPIKNSQQNSSEEIEIQPDLDLWRSHLQREPSNKEEEEEEEVIEEEEEEEEEEDFQPYICNDCIGIIAQYIPKNVYKPKEQQKLFNSFKLASKTCYLELYNQRTKKIIIRNIALKKGKYYSKTLKFPYLINILKKTKWLAKKGNILYFCNWEYPYKNFEEHRIKAFPTIKAIKRKIEKHNKTHKAAIARRKKEKVKEAIGNIKKAMYRCLTEDWEDQVLFCGACAYEEIIKSIKCCFSAD